MMHSSAHFLCGVHLEHARFNLRESWHSPYELRRPLLSRLIYSNMSHFSKPCLDTATVPALSSRIFLS